METLFSRTGDSAGVPKVTVVVSLWNDARSARDVLNGIREQTIKDLDLIVVDDCSSDGSAGIAKAWMEEHGERFRRATLFRQDKTCGSAAVRNQGFENAETEFVFPLNADYGIYPSCLEKLARALASSGCAFAYCFIERHGQDSDQKGLPLMNLRQWDPSVLGNGSYIDALALFRRDAWRLAGKYNESLPPGWEDYDFWLKIARCNGSGVHVPQILAKYRAHGSSMTTKASTARDSKKKLSEYFRETYPEFFAK